MEDANKLYVNSQNYRMSALDKRLDRSEMKLLEVRMDSRLRLETMVLSGVGVIALVSFIMSLYSCALYYVPLFLCKTRSSDKM